MKKKVILLVAIMLVATGSYMVFAKEHMGAKKEYKKMGMCPMHSMMFKCMMTKQMVATQDGGVVVLVGKKMMKYDKDLNRVKETELDLDWDEMKGKMGEMMEKCPMCKKKMDINDEMMEED